MCPVREREIAFLTLYWITTVQHFSKGLGSNVKEGGRKGRDRDREREGKGEQE